jgi:hypothetical protein
MSPLNLNASKQQDIKKITEISASLALMSAAI